MSDKKRKEFDDKIAAAHRAVNEYARGRLEGNWFEQGLDHQLTNVIDDLLSWGIERRPYSRDEIQQLNSFLKEDALKA